MVPASHPSPASKAAALRSLLGAPEPVILVGAHNGLGARLVEEAGFEGVWASGFEISASHGEPDASILTMTDVLTTARLMNHAVGIPIIADCDTGFGNAINAIRTVQAFEAAGVAGICIEDSVFPKRCSFYSDVRRELADFDEHRSKVRAAVDAKTNPDFVVIARTEALIAGYGLEEALRRAQAYAATGADAVLIHSSHATADEVAAFAQRWNWSVPLVCVPTTYGATTVSELSALGFKMIIFANHGLRAAVRAVQDALRRLRETGTAHALQQQIAPLSEIYRLVDLDGLRAQEQEYLPAVPQGVPR